MRILQIVILVGFVVILFHVAFLINTLFDKIKSVFSSSKGAVRIEIIQIVGLGLVATFLAAVLNQHKSSITSLFIVFVGSVMFLLLIDQIHAILQMIERVASEAKVSNVYVETLLKLLGLLISLSLERKLQRMQDRGNRFEN